MSAQHSGVNYGKHPTFYNSVPTCEQFIFMLNRSQTDITPLFHETSVPLKYSRILFSFLLLHKYGKVTHTLLTNSREDLLLPPFDLVRLWIKFGSHKWAKFPHNLENSCTEQIPSPQWELKVKTVVPPADHEGIFCVLWRCKIRKIHTGKYWA